MKALLLAALAAALLRALPSPAQASPGASPSPASASHPLPADVPAVQQTLRTFFDGMRRGDSAMVRGTLAPGAVLHSIGGRPGQPLTLQTESIAGFLRAVGTPHPATWDERVQVEQVLVDGPLASVWAPYSFYLGSQFSHCGYDSFQLVKLAGGWRIAYLIDTRRKEPCPPGATR